MLNKIWGGLFLIALFTALMNLITGSSDVTNQMVTGLFENASKAFQICIGLIATLILWLGLFAIAEESGLINIISKLLSPIIKPFFPEIPDGHAAFSSMGTNIIMTMLGMDNAALPSGLKTMQELQKLNSGPSIATRSQQMFMMYMTASIVIFPITTISLRLQAGSTNPSSIIIPAAIVGYSGLLGGLIYMCIVQKINPFRLIKKRGLMILFFLLLTVVCIGLNLHSLSYSVDRIGNILLLSLIALIMIHGLIKTVPLFEVFVKGGREGFKCGLKIIPYVVGMICAVGLVKDSGFFNLSQKLLSTAIIQMGFKPPEWLELLPQILIKPFSGSGSSAYMLQIFDKNGVDSTIGFTSALIQSSSDTTFYILAMCAGVAGLKKINQALWGAILVSIIGSLLSILFMLH